MALTWDPESEEWAAPQLRRVLRAAAISERELDDPGAPVLRRLPQALDWDDERPLHGLLRRVFLQVDRDRRRGATRA